MEVKFSREPASMRGLIQGLKKSKRRAIERSKQKVGIVSLYPNRTFTNRNADVTLATGG